MPPSRARWNQSQVTVVGSAGRAAGVPGFSGCGSRRQVRRICHRPKPKESRLISNSRSQAAVPPAVPDLRFGSPQGRRQGFARAGPWSFRSVESEQQAASRRQSFNSPVTGREVNFGADGEGVRVVGLRRCPSAQVDQCMECSLAQGGSSPNLGIDAIAGPSFGSHCFLYPEVAAVALGKL